MTRCTSAKPKGGLGSFEAESRAPKLREASLTIVAIQQAKLDTEASDFGSVEERVRTCKRVGNFRGAGQNQNGGYLLGWVARLRPKPGTRR